MNTPNEWNTLYRFVPLAGLVGVLLLVGAFLAAYLTQANESLFSLSPVLQNATEIPPMDIISETDLYAFHATIYTIWATMLLTLPAFCTVWFIRSRPAAEACWLAFWTVGLVAMIVHLYMAMGVLFEWNWQHILHDTVRVTIPIPDLVLTAWWTADVLLGWWLLNSQNRFLHAQRIALHIALLVVFLIGFIREGEIALSKAIGFASAVVIVIAVIVGLTTKRPVPSV